MKVDHSRCSVPCPRCGDTADKARCEFCDGKGRVGDARCWWNGCDAAKKAS